MAELKKRQPVEILNHWLHMLATEGRRMTQWEKDRVEDWQAQLDEGHGLTEAQEDKLEQIYAERTA